MGRFAMGVAAVVVSQLIAAKILGDVPQGPRFWAFLIVGAGNILMMEIKDGKPWFTAP